MTTPFDVPPDIPPSLEPLDRSFAYRQIDLDLKDIFTEVFEELLRPSMQRINTYGMPHRGDFTTLERFVKQEGLALERRTQREVFMRELYRGWRARNPKRGTHFLRYYLQLLWPGESTLQQLWHTPTDTYPQGASSTPGPGRILTSRLKLGLVLEDVASVDRVIASFRAVLAARFVLETTILQRINAGIRMAGAMDDAEYQVFDLTATLPDYPRTINADDFRGSGLRGVNGYGTWGPLPDADYVDTMRDWGVQLTRTWLKATWNGTAYVIAADALTRMDQHLAQLAARRLYALIVVSLDSPDMPWPAGRRTAFRALWASLATRWNGNRTIAGFDILNEPYTVEPGAGPGGSWTPAQVEQVGADWETLAVQVIDDIRAVDSARCVIYEVGLGGNPWFWTPARSLLPRPNVVYSPHCYIPYELTHDQVSQYTAGQPIVPSVSYGPAQQAEHEASVDLFVDWQPNIPLLVGEFSCAKWALNESARYYVARSIELFEDVGASWLYHEFRGAPPWDAEAPLDTSLTYTRSENAPTALVLRGALALPPGQYVAPAVPSPPPPPPPPPAQPSSTLLLVRASGALGSTSFVDESATARTVGQFSPSNLADVSDGWTPAAGNSIRFPNSQAMLSVAAGQSSDLVFNAGQDFTLEMHYNVGSAPRISVGGASLELLVFSSGTAAIRINGSFAWTSASGAAGPINNLAISRQGTNLRIFAGGSLLDTITNNVNLSLQELLIGGSEAGNNQPRFLRYVRISNVALYTAPYSVPVL